MKTLLTFLTITLFSYSANAEYNKKFTAEKCGAIYLFAETLNTTFVQLFMKYSQENGGKLVGQQGEVLGEAVKAIGGISNLYQTFCKD